MQDVQAANAVRLLIRLAPLMLVGCHPNEPAIEDPKVSTLTPKDRFEMSCMGYWENLQQDQTLVIRFGGEAEFNDCSRDSARMEYTGKWATDGKEMIVTFDGADPPLVFMLVPKARAGFSLLAPASGLNRDTFISIDEPDQDPN